MTGAPGSRRAAATFAVLGLVATAAGLVLVGAGRGLVAILGAVAFAAGVICVWQAASTWFGLTRISPRSTRRLKD
jgi:hypothetical protein